MWKRSDQDIRIAHGADRRFVAVEVRPHVGAALAARGAGEPRLEIGQPDVIGPSVSHDGANDHRCGL
jgi:hypothetical protein